MTHTSPSAARNELMGQIPGEIGYLDSLVNVDMDQNSLSGTLPTGFCLLHDLDVLRIQSSELKGDLPDCIGDMKSLNKLLLRGNALTGTIPTQICQLQNLELLDLRDNMLGGSIPPCIGEMTSLQMLFLSNNQLTGSLPESVRKLGPSLFMLYLDDNKLGGDPTKVLTALHFLKKAYLEKNNFTGVLDDEFLRLVSGLKELDLSNNAFSSPETGPAFPFRLLDRSIEVLDLAHNKLSGNFPKGSLLEDESRLTFLSIHDNRLTGNLPNETLLSSLSSLEHIDLSANNFEGTISDLFFRLDKVRNIVLSDNKLLSPGEIPSSSLTTMSLHLEGLSLRGTNRVGSLPSLAAFDRLKMLDLSSNKLTGPIPNSYGQLPEIQYMLLSKNQGLRGTIPSFAVQTPLKVLLLDGTEVTGNFASICQLPVFSASKQLGADGENYTAVVDCKQTGLTCDCCRCCGGQDGCSQPQLSALDYSWEQGYEKFAYDIGIQQIHSQTQGTYDPGHH